MPPSMRVSGVPLQHESRNRDALEIAEPALLRIEPAAVAVPQLALGNRASPRKAGRYSHPAVKIFMPAGAEAPVYAPYVEHYPPDANAAFRWLMNRQPNKWRDRQEVNHTGTIEQRILAMTPEERVADAIALVERVRARLRQPDAQMIIEHEEEEN
jgi:hypothetical protein